MVEEDLPRPLERLVKEQIQGVIDEITYTHTHTHTHTYIHTHTNTHMHAHTCKEVNS